MSTHSWIQRRGKVKLPGLQGQVLPQGPAKRSGQISKGRQGLINWMAKNRGRQKLIWKQRGSKGG